jgi:spermidine synthase
VEARVISAERAPRLLLFLIGQNLMLLNYVLIRRMTASLYNLETSAWLTSIAYFTGISLGYLRPSLFPPRLVRALFPVFLALQIGLILGGPLLAHVLQRRSETLAFAALFLLTALGGTSLYSIFLPTLVGSSEENMRRFYAAEIMGSLAGILLLPLLARAGMTLVAAAYLASFFGVAVMAGVRAPWIAAMAAPALAFLFGYDAADKSISAAIYQDELGEAEPVRVVYTRDSPYHKIEIVASARGERMLMLDGQLHFEPAEHEGYSYFVAEYPARLLAAAAPPKVAVAGCGSMSTVGRIGDVASAIAIVDLDEDVFEASRRFFAPLNRLGELHNWTFTSDDAKHFFGVTRESFDLVVDDIPPAKTRQVALTYTREFFALVRARLTPRGIFSMPSLVSVHARQRGYGRRILATLVEVFDQVYVLSVRGSSYCFATGTEISLDEPSLRRAIDHPDRDAVRVVLPDEARRLVQGIRPITVDNMADLIEEE